MIADALKFTVLAIQEEAFVGNNLYAANTEAGDVFIHLFTVYVYFGRCFI